MRSMHEGSNHWQELIADDIEFNGPVQQTKGKDDFIKLNHDFLQFVIGMNIHRHTASDDTVATEVTIKIKSPEENKLSLDLAEFYDIVDGKIQSVKIYYDPREFIKKFM